MRKIGALAFVLAAGGCMQSLPFDWGAQGSGGGGAGGTGGAATVCTPGETRECYTGPEGTKGQGICKPGQETCNADGSAFGACEGETLPKDEDCGTAMDENCDGLAPPCEGTCLWSKAFGDDKSQIAQILAFDPTGAVILAGSFSGGVSFGGETLTANPGQGSFLAKLDAKNGDHAWSKGFSSGVQSFVSVAVDAAGDVTALGKFAGLVDFGGGALDGGASSTFVVQYGADGSHRWSHAFSGGLQNPQSLAVGASGEVFATGSFLGTTDFGAGPAIAKSGGSDAFVVKLAGVNGAHLWSKTFGDGSDQLGLRIVVDPQDGNIVFGGNFAGSIDFGSGTLTNDQPGQTVVLAKLAALDGSPLWTRQFHGDNNQALLDMTKDQGGGLVVAGSFFGTSDLGGSATTTSAGGADIYVAKFSLASGEFIWGTTFGQDGDQTVRGVAADSMGNLVLTGPLSDDTDFGGGPLAAAGLDVYVAKLDAAAGKHLWSKRFGDDTDQAGLGVAVDAAGNVLLDGFFKGSIDFGCGKLTSAGDRDVFVAELSP